MRVDASGIKSKKSLVQVSLVTASISMSGNEYFKFSKQHPYC